MVTEFSYQLYSSRKFGPLSRTMPMLASHGYAQIEGYEALYNDTAAVDELTRLLEVTGLAMPSGHFGIDRLESDVDGVLDTAKRLGMSTLFCPYLPPDRRPNDAQGYLAFGKRLQEASKPYRAAGLTFGWHNHDFEFAPLPDGSVPLARLFEGGPDLAWEIDIAWIARGGADPSQWIRREGSRIVAVHVKDIAPEGEAADEDGWADIGQGTLDWAGLMAELRATPARLLIMEHDNPSDDERFARRSIAAAKSY